MKHNWYEIPSNSEKLYEWMMGDVPIRVTGSANSIVITVLEIYSDYFVGECNGKREYVFYADIDSVDVAE